MAGSVNNKTTAVADAFDAYQPGDFEAWTNDIPLEFDFKEPQPSSDDLLFGESGTQPDEYIVSQAAYDPYLGECATSSEVAAESQLQFGDLQFGESNQPIKDSDVTGLFDLTGEEAPEAVVHETSIAAESTTNDFDFNTGLIEPMTRGSYDADASYPDPETSLLLANPFPDYQPVTRMPYPGMQSVGTTYVQPAPQYAPRGAGQYIQGVDGCVYYAHLAPSPVQRQYAIARSRYGAPVGAPVAPMAFANGGHPGPAQPRHALPAAVHSKKRGAQDLGRDADEEKEARHEKRVRYSTSSSAMENNDPRKKWGYSYPNPPIAPWGSKKQFTYFRNGELRALDDHKKRMSKSDMEEFFFGQPGHRNGKPMTLWIGRMPFNSNGRFHTEDIYRRCRYEGCVDPNGTIEKGTYSVVCDEFQGCDHKQDPFKLPRFHLWCIERHMDFPKMCRELDVRMEDREVFAKGAKPDDVALGMCLKKGGNAAGELQTRVGREFLQKAKTGVIPPVPADLAKIGGDTDKVRAFNEAFGAYPGHTWRGSPQFRDMLLQWNEDVEHGPYIGTLGYRMAQAKKEKDLALQRHDKEREKATDAPSRFLEHGNDLIKAIVARRETRKEASQFKRTRNGTRRSPPSKKRHAPAAYDYPGYEQPAAQAYTTYTDFGDMSSVAAFTRSHGPIPDEFGL